MRPGRRTHRSIPVIDRYSTGGKKGCAIRRVGFQTVRNLGTLERDELSGVLHIILFPTHTSPFTFQ